MPVFISHRTKDDKIAQQVYRRLHFHHHIACYIDDFDDEARNTKKITDLILNRINSCTHLIAVVTSNTKGSWWVPFEIGVARRAPRIISSFTSLYSFELPEFLKEWPVLKGQNAIDIFARFYKEGKVIQEKQYSNLNAQIRAVDVMHNKLIDILKQN